MAWLCKYIKSLLQGNENLSVKSALFSASGSAYVFMFSDNSSPLLSVQSPQTQLLRSIFWWCLCLKWGRPHSGFLKCCRAVFQSVYAHYFSFSWLHISRTAIRGCAPRGSHFLCLVWSSLIAYPVLIRSPLQARIPVADGTLGGCARSAAECLPEKSHFRPGDSCLPRERAERGANEKCFHQHTAVWPYLPINIHFHANQWDQGWFHRHKTSLVSRTQIKYS